MDPVTGKVLLGAVKSAATRALGALRRELARNRGNDAPLLNLGEINDALSEAIAVLANQADGLGGTLKTGLKALLSRPEIFESGPPRDWIVTAEGQDDLRTAAIAAIFNEDIAPHLAAAELHYARFLTGADGEPSFTEVVEEALDFINRSLRRDLSLGERMILGAIASFRAEAERLAQPDTGDLVDAHVTARLERARKARFFQSAKIDRDALEFAKALTEGRLRGASPRVRANALAWCSRFLVFRDVEEAQRYADAARDILGEDSEPLLVARAFIASTGDLEAGLKLLDPDRSGLEATAMFQMLRNSLGTKDGIERAIKAGFGPRQFDSDGRYAFLV
jgi:uncharacterized membrane protein